MIPVQYIISTEQQLSPLSHAKAALAAGCQWIQLKIGKDSKDLQKIAMKIKALCRENGATFIIENDTELVKAIDGDGVHLTNGASVAETRQFLGEGYLIGTNASNAEEAILQKRQSADYICIGPYNDGPTPSTMAITLQDCSSIVAAMEAENKIVPLCVFGHFNATQIPLLVNAGIRGIALEFKSNEIKEKQVKEYLQQYLHD